jgi:DNA-binding NtrC family response regulator
LTADTKEAVVWIIDRQQWPRALLRAELLERGYDAVGFEGVDEALNAFHFRLYARPQVMVLELRDLAEGEEKARALTGLGIPTILLAGAAEEHRAIPGERWWAALLRRPFTIGRVVEEVGKQMKISGGLR